MVLDLVTDPDGFFERRADNPGWVGPALVVLVVGVLNVLSQIPVYRALVGALPESAGTFVLLIQAVGAIFGLVFTFVLWFVVGIILHVVASVAFDGEGNIWSTVKLSGWGYVPNILSALVSAFVYFTVFSGVTFPDDPQQTQQFLAQLQNRPEFLVATVVGVVVLLWSGLLWAFATRNAHMLTMRESVITAAVPVALLLLLQVAGLASSGIGGGL